MAAISIKFLEGEGIFYRFAVGCMHGAVIVGTFKVRTYQLTCADMRRVEAPSCVHLKRMLQEQHASWSTRMLIHSCVVVCKSSAYDAKLKIKFIEFKLAEFHATFWGTTFQFSQKLACLTRNTVCLQDMSHF